jgi:uncharacterized membrane protein YdbT with pleckstrin-like domain
VFDVLKGWVLRFAKVPAEPHPPAGSPGSLRVFRAAGNYWKYLLVIWGIRQMAGAVALVIALSFTWTIVETAKRSDDITVVTNHGKVKGKITAADIRPYANLIQVLELAGVAFFFVQVPFSLAAARLGYEMRWYMVTDRSMRLREGIFGVREMTLTFANVQNITIRQGPLQRLLGISDVVVRTAGGGSSEGGHPAHAQIDTMHTGVLRAVDNAESVRDLILDRLRKLRDAGLGDPDDRHHVAVATTPGEGAIALRAAARELLDEARALRSALS